MYLFLTFKIQYFIFSYDEKNCCNYRTTNNVIINIQLTKNPTIITY